jgi:hypothetical protein
MRFATPNPDVHFVDTGKIIVHNYPPEGKSAAYITRIYEARTNGSNDTTEVEGDIIYIETLPDEQRALAVCIGEAQAALRRTMRREDWLTQVKNK